MASEASNPVQLPRLVVPGDIIIPKGRQKGEVVRSVSVVLHMADGTDVVYEDDDEVRVAPTDHEPVSLADLKEAHQREIEHADRAIEEAQKRLEEIEQKQRAIEDMEAQVQEREKLIAERAAEAERRLADATISEDALTLKGQ